MALRIEWDKFEVALLIDACEQVQQKKITKPEMVSRLSSALRRRAERSGIVIDDIFRNENGISLQMTKMDYLLTDGKTGWPGASKLYAEIAGLRKKNPDEYRQLLNEAKWQIDEREEKVVLDNKAQFKQWLSIKLPKKYTIETIMQALDEGSMYCRSHSICKESFWDITDKSRFTAVSSKLLSMKFYRLTHKSTAAVLDRAVPLYKEFLGVISERPIPTQLGKDIAPMQPDVSKGAETVEKELFFLAQESSKDMRASLDKTLGYLKERYEVRLHYDHLSNPDHKSNDMLFKVRNSKKDIIWVYYIDSRPARYISIETEPEYIEDISGNLSGFSRVQIRTSHPCQKMFYDNYESIKESLIAICDAIDLYFAETAMLQSHEDRMKLYQKLYSVSRVYDDPSGLTLSKIMSLIGNESDEQLVREILEDASWATQLSNDTYSFSRNTALIPRESVAPYKMSPGNVVTDSAFYNYLREERGMAEATCRSYVSAIRTAEGYARSNGFVPYKIYDCSISDASQVLQALLNNAGFIDFNTQQHNRFSAAFAKLTEYAGQTSLFLTDDAVRQTVSVKSEPTDYDKEKFELTLMRRYRSGMQFDSIDFENFREMYELLFDESLPFNDDELEERLRYCGIYFKDRLFPAEGIIDENTKEKLFAYIDSSFSSEKKVLYYKAIFEDLSDDFASCYTLSDENMLRAYIEFTAEKGKYYFFADYMSKEKNVSIDHTAEIEEYLLNAGKPMSIEDVCDALSHIPRDQVVRIISFDNRFLRNAKGEYFHVDIFEVTDAELERIAGIINEYIQQNEYAIWTDVWNEIQEKMPVFLENNLYLSWLGIRNVLAQRFAGRFNFESAVISMPKDRYAMRDIYQLYAKHHAEFTADEIYYLSKELDTVIYFDALAEVSVRVSHDLFVSKDRIRFDIDAIDKTIGSFISKDYIRIRDIDSYLTFPNVGYEWNEYLLESYVYSYSKKYMLLNNGFSLHNVAGAVVKKAGSIQEFVDACASVLADAPISLNKKDTLNYLAEVNMITRRSYRDLDLAIRKATQIRARKG